LISGKEIDLDGFLSEEGDFVFIFEVDEFGDGVLVLGGEERDGDLLEGGCLDAGVVGKGFEVKTGFDDFGVEFFPSDSAAMVEVNFFPEIEQTVYHFDISAVELSVPVLKVLLGKMDQFQEGELLSPFIKFVF
jgi:hypothetical protein